MIPAKLPPWQHQVDGYEFAMERQRVLLAPDMGTGKSAIAVWIAAPLKRVLIICPKAVVDVWPKQFDLHCPTDDRVLALRAGSVKKRVEMARAHVSGPEHDGPLVVVVNWQAFSSNLFFEWSRTVKWDLVVCDECHTAKGAGGKFSRRLGMIAKRVPRVLGLTGTPMPHSPMDIYAQARFIDPNHFGTSYVRFRSRYAVMGGFEGRQVIAYQNQDELAAKLSKFMFRVEAGDVLDLPPVMHEHRSFELGAEERRVYQAMAKDLVTLVRDQQVTAANALVKVIRLAQICSGHITDEDGNSLALGTSKKDALAALFDEAPIREPIVIFCRFRSDLDRVAEVAQSQMMAYAELSGRVNELDLWQSGMADVIGVQIQAGGAGIDLTRARIGVYYSIGYSLGDYQQSLARIHRPGQERPVIYYHLTALQTLEPLLYKALEAKRDIIDFVMELANQ